MPTAVQEDGSIFIDRSPKHFQHVLEYLRSGTRALLSISEEVQDELLLEAEFYSLNELAEKMRRCRLMDKHRMTFSPRAVKIDEDKFEIGVLHGRRYGAALFDVQNPDAFDIAFDCSDGFANLPELPENHPKLFVGIVHKDVQLSSDWQTFTSPLPRHQHSPLHDASYCAYWTGPTWPGSATIALPAAACEALWPAEVEAPPCLVDGVFLALTDCVFPGVDATARSNEAHAFLTQVVTQGDFKKACAEELSNWSNRPIHYVQMSLARTTVSSRLYIECGELGGNVTCPVTWTLNLEVLDLDRNIPYRPVIYGTTAVTSVHDNCPRS